MNKYELALVVSAKVEDEVRNATVEKAKEYIRAGDIFQAVISLILICLANKAADKIGATSLW